MHAIMCSHKKKKMRSRTSFVHTLHTPLHGRLQNKPNTPIQVCAKRTSEYVLKCVYPTHNFCRRCFTTATSATCLPHSLWLQHGPALLGCLAQPHCCPCICCGTEGHVRQLQPHHRHNMHAGGVRWHKANIIYAKVCHDDDDDDDALVNMKAGGAR